MLALKQSFGDDGTKHFLLQVTQLVVGLLLLLLLLLLRL